VESSIMRGGLESTSAAGLGVEVEAQRARRAVTTRDGMLRLWRVFTARKATLDDERYISTKPGEFLRICPLYSADFPPNAHRISDTSLRSDWCSIMVVEHLIRSLQRFQLYTEL